MSEDRPTITEVQEQEVITCFLCGGTLFKKDSYRDCHPICWQREHD